MRVDPLIVGAASLGLWLLQIVVVVGGSVMVVAEIQPSAPIATLSELVGATVIGLARLLPFALVATVFAARFPALRSASLLPVPQPLPSSRIEVPRRGTGTGSDGNSLLWRHGAAGAALIGYGLVLRWLTSLETASSRIISLGVIVTAAAGIATIGIGTSTMMATVHTLPRATVRRAVALLTGSIVVGGVGQAVMHMPISLALLERNTLHAVELVLRLLYSDVLTDPAYRRVGTAAFRVRVETPCSGIEGIALGVAVAGFYLYLARHRLRFPRALLLIPAVAAAVAVMNVLRIVALIIVGQHAPALAVGGFHSAAGWFLFALTTALVIPLGERSLRLRSAAVAPAVVTADPPLPFLLPLIVSLATGVVITMLGLGDTRWVLLRYALAVAAAVLVWRRWPRIMIPRSSLPWLAGAVLAVMWIVTAISVQIASPVVALDAPWFAAYAAGFVLVTPMVEEIAFRGYLMRRLVSARFDAVRLRDTSWWAVVVSSVLFGAMHGMWAEATIAGIVFASVARRFDALGPALAAHACTNALLLAYGIATGNYAVVG